MAVFSKLFLSHVRDHSHTCDENCFINIIKVSRLSFVNLMLVYSLLNGISLLVKRRKLKSLSTWITFTSDTLRQALTFTIISTIGEILNCVIMENIGAPHPYIGLIGQYALSILVGRIHHLDSKKKHCEFSYVLAFSSVYSWLDKVGRLPFKPYDKVLLYCMCFAFLSYRYTCGEKHKLSKQMRYIFGFEVETQENLSNEVPRLQFNESQHKPSITMKRLRFPQIIESFKLMREAFLGFGPKNQNCIHQNNCIPQIILGFLKSFALGSAISVTLLIPQIFSCLFDGRRSQIKPIIRNGKFVQLAAFCASTSVVFKTVCCLLNYSRNRNYASNSLIAGFLAGFPIMFYPSNFIIFLTFVTAVQHFYELKAQQGYLPEVNELMVDHLFALVGSFVMYLFIFRYEVCSTTLKKCVSRMSPGLDERVKRYRSVVLPHFT